MNIYSIKYFLLVFSLLLSQFNYAQVDKEDKTLSPYFFVQSENAEVDQLPLLHTEANVNISGVIADVKVTQVYKNNGKSPLEAIYIFPTSTNAGVYAMKMTIGERSIEAKIEEKQKARADYEAAKQEGKSATLLEQQRPNVFQMNVANIMPGDEIKVELSYTEALIPEEGIYEFVYPTVVGPRYNNQLAENLTTSSETWTQNPYLSEEEKPTYTFDMNIALQAGIPIKGATCNSHDVAINFTGQDKVKINLKESDKTRGNKDFIFKYQLKGEKIANGMLLYEGEKENFFMMMMQPPKRIESNQIPPREYIFIIDVSGSMNGFPLDVSKSLMNDLLGKLKPTDRFNVLFFAGSNYVLSKESLTASPENIKHALNEMDKQEGYGGTELLAALQQALAMKETESYSRTFIAVTDGYVRVEAEAFDLIRNNLNKANFYAFGIGSSVNRHLIEGMARVGYGEPFIVTNQDEASPIAEKFRKYIQSPVLTNIDIQFEGIDAYDVEPKTIPDLMAERPLVIYGKYNKIENASIKIKGKTGKGNFKQNINIDRSTASSKNKALRYLWARNKIKMLSDYEELGYNGSTPERIKEITDLGLNYNLLTNYTSFIAIDSKVRNKNGESTTVKQPLPLPEGVTESSISHFGLGATTNASTRLQIIPAEYETVTEQVEQADGSYKTISKKIIRTPATTRVVEIPKKEEKKEEKLIFINYQVQPEFPGGDKALLEFIYGNLKYPQEDKAKGLEGRVIVTFTIDKEGNVKNINVVRSPSEFMSAEAIRIIQLMPKWTPGKQRGKAVEVQYNLPIKFEL